MGRILLAFRVFFRTLFNAAAAERTRALLESEPPTAETTVAPAPKPAVAEKPKPAEPKPARSDALTLLATLQREARFLDFVKEPIDGYSDAQVGSAVREVHRECAKVLERMFAPQPIIDQGEGSDFDVPADFDAERFRLTGKVVDQPPYRGRLVHHGWEASKCELPTWTGNKSSARVVAAAEIEIR